MAISTGDQSILDQAAAINRRRLRIVRVADVYLDRMLKGEHGATTDLPADAHVVEIQRDIGRADAWVLKVHSSTWDPLHEGDAIMELPVICRRETADSVDEEMSRIHKKHPEVQRMSFWRDEGSVIGRVYAKIEAQDRHGVASGASPLCAMRAALKDFES